VVTARAAQSTHSSRVRISSRGPGALGQVRGVREVGVCLLEPAEHAAPRPGSAPPAPVRRAPGDELIGVGSSSGYTAAARSDRQAPATAASTASQNNLM